MALYLYTLGWSFRLTSASPNRPTVFTVYRQTYYNHVIKGRQQINLEKYNIIHLHTRSTIIQTYSRHLRILSFLTTRSAHLFIKSEQRSSISHKSGDQPCKRYTNLVLRVKSHFSRGGQHLICAQNSNEFFQLK
jgi:hypothetical protein